MPSPCYSNTTSGTCPAYERQALRHTEANIRQNCRAMPLDESNAVHHTQPCNARKSCAAARLFSPAPPRQRIPAHALAKEEVHQGPSVCLSSGVGPPLCEADGVCDDLGRNPGSLLEWLYLGLVEPLPCPRRQSHPRHLLAHQGARRHNPPPDAAPPVAPVSDVFAIVFTRLPGVNGAARQPATPPPIRPTVAPTPPTTAAPSAAAPNVPIIVPSSPSNAVPTSPGRLLPRRFLSAGVSSSELYSIYLSADVWELCQWRRRNVRRARHGNHVLTVSECNLVLIQSIFEGKFVQ